MYNFFSTVLLSVTRGAVSKKHITLFLQSYSLQENRPTLQAEMEQDIKYERQKQLNAKLPKSIFAAAPPPKKNKPV